MIDLAPNTPSRTNTHTHTQKNYNFDLKYNQFNKRFIKLVS